MALPGVDMQQGQGLSFGALLRRHRADAGLTQEQLAERAGLSRRGIADLERGARLTPYANTLERLAAALGLSDAERAALVAAGRARPPDGVGTEPAQVVHGEPGAGGSLYRPVFVGREAELRELRAACDRALSGNGGLALVVGEPGIGKTALCGQLARYAASRGAPTHVGHLYEEGSFSLPYLPFVEALREYVLGRPIEQLRGELGSLAPEVARVLPEVGERLGVEPRPARDPEEDRWRLLTALTDFLRTAATARPLLLILEDLQWADRGTLDLLLFLSRRLMGARLLVVGTYRDVEIDRAHPLAMALVELRRGPELSLTRVPMRGLGASDVQRLLASLIGEEVSRQLADALHRQTEGNPLFVQEVVRDLVEEGLIAQIEDQWRAPGGAALATRLPAGVRDVIARRLSKLSPACNQVLSAAAVIGREFGLETLRQVADLEDEPLLEALEQAQRVRVLDDASVAGEVRFRFSHALFRQTLYEELFTPRRLALHQRVARVLEAQYSARLEDHAAELSEHFAQSSDPADLDRARRYAELAAARATRVSAHGEAVRHLRSALHLLGLAGDDAEQRCDLLLALGEAMIVAGDPKSVADQVAPEAFSLAEARDDRRRAYEACFLAVRAHASHHGFLSVGPDEVRTWASRMDRYAQPDSSQRVTADAVLAWSLRSDGQEAAAHQVELRSLRLARQLGEVGEISIQLLERWTVPPHRQHERRDLSNELRPTLDAGQAMRRCLGLFNAGDVQLTWGDRGQAEALWGRLPELVEQSQLPWVRLVARRVGLLLDCLDGRLEQALEAGRALEEEGEALGAGPMGRASAATYLRRTCLYLGQVDRALEGFPPALRRAEPAELPASSFRGVFSAQLAVCLAHAGRAPEAQAILDQFFRARTIGQPGDETPMPILVALLEAAVLLDDESASRRLVEPLRVAAHLVAVDNSMTVVARHLGAAMALLGDRQRAVTYTGQAIEVARSVGFRPELALSRVQLAELELDDGRRAHALRLLADARTELEAMHMRPALERARALG